MAEIEIRELAELAKLARLRQATSGSKRTSEEVAGLLRSFAMLQDVNTEGVEPSAYPMTIAARLRPDEPTKPLPQDQVLRNAPRQRAGCFLVPRVIEG